MFFVNMRYQRIILILYLRHGTSPFCSKSWSVGRSHRLILRGSGLGSDHPCDDQSAIYRYGMEIELLAFPELEIVW